MIAKYFNSFTMAVIHSCRLCQDYKMHEPFFYNAWLYKWYVLPSGLSHFFVPFARFVRGSEKQRRSDCCSFLWKRIGAACGAKKKKSIRRERLKFLYPVWLDCLKERLTSCWNHNHLIWWENTFFRHSKPLKCVSLTRWQNCNV